MTRRRASKKQRASTARKQRARLRVFLEFHGHLRNNDHDLAKSIRAMQAFHGIPETGKTNATVKRFINARRCSHPDCMPSLADDERRFRNTRYAPPRLAAGAGLDITPATPAASGNEPLFEFIPQKWAKLALTFAFAGAPPASLGELARNAVRRAFDTWSDVQVLTLTELHEPANADIRILWTPGRIADPNSLDPFTGPGNTLAFGYYPLSYLGELAGDLHFDSAEPWSVNGSGTDLESVALHEIGHCLGIGHSRVVDSIMVSGYQMRRSLSQFDKNELQRIYA